MRRAAVAAAVLVAMLAASGASSSVARVGSSRCLADAWTSSAASPLAVTALATVKCSAREAVISMTLCLQRTGVSVPWVNRSCESSEVAARRVGLSKLTHLCSYTTFHYRWRAQLIVAVVSFGGAKDSGVATGNAVSMHCA